MADEQTQHRRVDDRDRMLNTRLDHIERDNQNLDHKVSALEGQLNIIKIEQQHLRELLEARMRVIDESQKLQLAELKAIGLSIQRMGEQAENTPAGRLLTQEVATVRDKCEETAASLDEHKRAHDELVAWRNQVEGVLVIMKWVGAGGLVALGISILRLLRILT